MLYLIGAGLGDVRDLSVKSVEAIESCAEVYLESYTSSMSSGIKDFEEFLKKKVHFADRYLTEEGCEEFIDKALKENVAMIVVGDALSATTHHDLMLRANKKGCEVRLMHNASVLTGVGVCGLSLYRYGQTVSIVRWEEERNVCPESFFDKILINYTNNLHTLCLLDIKLKEKTIESIMSGGRILAYEPEYYMSVQEACSILIKICIKRGDCPVNKSTRVIGLSRVGWPDGQQKLVFSTIGELAENDTSENRWAGQNYPQSLVIPASMDLTEEEFVAHFCGSL